MKQDLTRLAQVWLIEAPLTVKLRGFFLVATVTLLALGDEVIVPGQQYLSDAQLAALSEHFPDALPSSNGDDEPREVVMGISRTWTKKWKSSWQNSHEPLGGHCILDDVDGTPQGQLHIDNLDATFGLERTSGDSSWRPTEY